MCYNLFCIYIRKNLLFTSVFTMTMNKLRVQVQVARAAFIFCMPHNNKNNKYNNGNKLNDGNGEEKVSQKKILDKSKKLFIHIL